MAKEYRVIYQEIHTYSVWVEAQSEEEAIDMVRDGDCDEAKCIGVDTDYHEVTDERELDEPKEEDDE